MINPFKQFNQRILPLLNDMWKRLESVREITGDDYVNVRKTSSGTSLKLNIPAVRRRIAKQTGTTNTTTSTIRRARVTQDAPSGSIITADLLDPITGLSSLSLNYDGQTTDFTVGATITGATSGATATIDADADNGAEGILTISSLTGNFVDNETITGSSGGSALANGTEYYANGINVYCNISNGSALNSAAPRLIENDEIFVVQSVFEGGGLPITRWYCVTNFDTDEECVCSSS